MSLRTFLSKLSISRQLKVDEDEAEMNRKYNETKREEKDMSVYMDQLKEISERKRIIGKIQAVIESGALDHDGLRGLEQNEGESNEAFEIRIFELMKVLGL